MKDTLNGISEELIQKHKITTIIYWYYGHSNYYITEFYAKTVAGGQSLHKLNVSSHSIQQRSHRENKVIKENTNMIITKRLVVRVGAERVAQRLI
jgi:hypothetical protein